MHFACNQLIYILQTNNNGTDFVKQQNTLTIVPLLSTSTTHITRDSTDTILLHVQWKNEKLTVT